MSLTDRSTGPTRRPPTHHRPPGHRPPGYRGGVRWGRVAIALACVAGLITLLVVGIKALVASGPAAITPMCTVVTEDGTYAMSPDQAANASTIAAVGHTLGLPDHAVTVALATSLQESRLLDLTGGDRDSVGLFQQRPSEGWGTPTQLLQPVYAATAFYQALEKVPGWQDLAVTEAAQDVQRSADPGAYALQEPEARSLAVAFTGEAPAAFTCHATPARQRAAGWHGALVAQLGTSASPAVTGDGADAEAGTPVDATGGWVLASWLVAHAVQYGFRAVSFAGRTWTLHRGTWVAGGPRDGVVHLS